MFLRIVLVVISALIFSACGNDGGNKGTPDAMVGDGAQDMVSDDAEDADPDASADECPRGQVVNPFECEVVTCDPADRLCPGDDSVCAPVGDADAYVCTARECLQDPMAEPEYQCPDGQRCGLWDVCELEP